MDKYRNTTNANTIRGAIARGVPLTGSASGVRSISSVDAFNTLGQFFLGEALGIGIAAGASKAFGFVAPKVARAIGAGARPMTVAERSAAVTRAGRTGVGKIGPSIKPSEPVHDIWGGDYPGIASEPFSSYDAAYARAGKIFETRNNMRGTTGFDFQRPDLLRPVSGRVVNNRYKGFTEEVTIEDGFGDPFDFGVPKSSATFDMMTNAMKKTLDWRATRGPLRSVAKVTRRVKR
jgi:hypothetical protein